ncbi:MAG: NADH-quinone oxidoreductase subunit C [Armatimonadetes bacterium]|nr:NADH-quinone oxidoreductase subunit C [Armatimonadota bacterium]
MYVLEASPTVKKLTENFQEAVIETQEFRGQTTVLVERSRIVEICEFCRDDPDLQYNFLSDVCGADYLGRLPRFEVVYHLLSLTLNRRVRLKVRVPEEDVRVPSVTAVWPTANWHERECYDMFGIVFDGHPDLRRILMPEDWEGHPLRKDYPARAKEIRPPFDDRIRY